MLQIKNIKKEYKTGSLVQKALDGVSLNLRDNEFVAILGPSGSGKSTLLNIIGGLDRYDSGDLIINGVSTKKYKDKDWDSYRNHTIGFIFQSYNLIPHQTILANVELALTISGISRAERRKRSVEALEKVGLGDQLHKKPNQMSGGQMQRVAIARALVNDPDILLADEPTGALDTNTSVQVMDLLKEVAEDRLVVMVTHNPELAEQYANRIVKLQDGVITSDTNPYVVDEEGMAPAVHRNLGKASMSFLTALSLSMNNLMTKKARTILVAFAGSIGIIGIALIMSLSNGVDQYIDDTERETLSEYPLTVQKSAMDITSMMTTAKETQDSEAESNAEVRERPIINNMFRQIKTNDLAALKDYFESGKTNIQDYTSAIEYSYDIEPLIYQVNEKGVIHQVNPDSALANSGLVPSGVMAAGTMNLSVFTSLPEETALYKEQYDVKVGRWPEKYNEAVVVVSEAGLITDYTSYVLGLRDYGELKDLLESYKDDKEVSDSEVTAGEYTYNDLNGITFKLTSLSDLYTYDKENDIWVDRSSEEDYLKNMLKDCEDLVITGVVKPKEDSTIAILTPGICYSYDLIEHVRKMAGESEVVKAQLASPDKNIFTGNTFDEDNERDGLDLDDMFSVDENAFKDAFKFDTSKLKFDMKNDFDTSGFSSLNLSEKEISEILKAGNINGDSVMNIFSDVVNGYFTYAKTDKSLANFGSGFKAFMESESTKKILKEEAENIFYQALKDSDIENKVGGYLEDILEDVPAYMVEHGIDNPDEATKEYLKTEAGKKKVEDCTKKLMADVKMPEINYEPLATRIITSYQEYVKTTGNDDLKLVTDSITKWFTAETGQKTLNDTIAKNIDTDALQKSVGGVMGKQMSSLTKGISDAIGKSMMKMMKQLPKAMSFDTSVFANAFDFNLDMTEMQSMFASMMTSGMASKENNLKTLGYAQTNDLNQISIYPVDFESKDEIKKILDDYNTMMKDQGQEEKVIEYTDIVGALMSSVTSIVNTISYVLIAFVAISLVVSSIMIGVITYISVLERKKEIGILRAIGASKGNISNVFNAETFITGLLAGLMGVGIALLLLIPANSIVHMIAGNDDVNAFLQPQAGAFLVVLSVVLTLIGGIIPSRKAAKSDPVAALRTE